MFPIYLNSFVTTGFQRGSKMLGIPTANLFLEKKVQEQILDCDGVYYGWAMLYPRSKSTASNESNETTDSTQSTESNESASLNLDQDEFSPYYYKPYKAIMSIGNNPHFNGVEKTIEPYLVNNFPMDFYDKGIKVIICGFIRPQRKFDNLQALIDTIHDDINKGVAILDTEEMSIFKEDAFFGHND